MTVTTPTINLLSRQRRVMSQERLQKRRGVTFAALVLVIYLAVFVPVILYRVFLGAQVRGVEKKIAEQEGVIGQYQAVENKYVLVASKLDSLGSFLETRRDTRQILESVYTLLPAETTLSTINFGNRGEAVEVNGLADTVFSFETLVSNVRGAVATGQFARALFSSVSRGESGEYAFGLELYLSSTEEETQEKETIGGEEDL